MASGKWKEHSNILIFLTLLCISLNFPIIHSQRATTPRDFPRTPPPSSYDNFHEGERSTRRPVGPPSDLASSENVFNEDELNFPYLIGRVTTRPSFGSLDGREESNTRRNEFDIRTTTRRSWLTQPSPTTPSHLEEEMRNRRVQIAPMLNLTAEDANDDIINTIWYRYHQNGSSVDETSLNVRGLRKLKLTFTCNDTVPIKWLSKRSFGTSEWKMDEYRHFSKGWRNSLDVLYTIILRLTFDKEDSIPKKQELFCTRVSSNEFPVTKQTVMELAKGANSTLALKLITDVSHHALMGNDEGNGGKLQYSEPLGANVDCLQELKWFGQIKLFECTSEGNSNLTMDFIYENCYDANSCERRFTSKRICWKPWTSLKRESKAPTDLWSRDPPPSGVVYCKRQGETSDNKTTALPFYNSLPHICPEEHPAGRRQLYIASDLPIPGDNVLRRDFVSFCPTKDAVIRNSESATAPAEEETPTKYAGENMTVSCIASLYHFSMGTRIGQRVLNGSNVFNAAITESTTTIKLSEGYVNYTAKVLITDTSVTGIYCENYLKQSINSIGKLLRIIVKTPRNLTIIEGLSQVSVYNYSGQSNFVLKCEAEGDPQPAIIWRKQNQPNIPESVREVSVTNGSVTQSALIFPSLRDNRRLNVTQLHGTYICEAINRLTTRERTFHVSLVTTNSSTITIVNTGSAVVQEEEEGSLWYVWAIVIPLFLLIVLAIIGFLVWKIKKQSRELSLLSKAEVDEFNYGKPDFLQSHSSTEEVNNYAAYLPYNQGYEVGKEQLELDPNAVLGSGAYAIVLKGVLRQKSGYDVPVAIKTAKPMDDVSFFKALLSELKIMGFIGTHQNIVNLVGAYTRNIQNREIFIAIEYCDKGSLLNYLRDNRGRFTSLVNESSEFPQNIVITRDSIVYPDREGITTITLIKWAQEIASGMDFLGQKKVIHGDLASRNILLTDHLVAKIGDFGLSRQLFEYANYIKKQMSPLPWKWLAIECLQDMKFSVKSDVWAYSILLYEIFTLGQVPYPGHSYNDEFLDALVGGKRPTKPAYTTNEIYNLMTMCWKDEAHERPSFGYIQEFFSKILKELVPQEYLLLHERVTSTRLTFPRFGSSSSSSVSGSPSNTLTNPHGPRANKDVLFNINPKTITATFKIK